MKKLKDNWLLTSLENLEKEYWGKPTFDSYLVTRVHYLRTISLKYFPTDDICLMLRQKFRLEYIIPLALNRLNSNILACDYNEAGLVKHLAKLPSECWIGHESYHKEFATLISKNQTLLAENNITISI